MPNQFFIIVEKNDSGKLQQFKNGKFNKETNEILKKHDSNYVWGIHKGTIGSIWNKIRKNDKVYLTVQREIFKISGIVSKKRKNPNFGELIYPTVIDKKQVNHFLFFDKLEKCSISYHELKNNVNVPKLFGEEGIHEIKKEYYSEKVKKVKPVKVKKLKKLPSEKIIGQAERRRRSVEGFVRNPTKVKNLKALYDNKCQIVQCDFILEYNSKNKKNFYSEVHHYNPLKKRADDDYGNMLVLCPNHHAEFDFRVKFIHRDGITIINQNGKETGETIKFRDRHALDIKNIEKQLEE